MIKRTLVSSAILMGLLTSIPVQADIFGDIGGWVDDNIIDPIEDEIIEPIEEAVDEVLDPVDDVVELVGNIGNAGIHDYKLDTDAWRIKALRLQNRLDHALPLNDALFIGTHNSFNATDYSNGTSYIDPNHRLSLYDQLNAGMVSLELDVHYDFNVRTGMDLMLCHRKEKGEISDGACSVFDRTFKQGLTEINNWLADNPNDVIFIYIEDFMEGGEYNKAISYLNQTIGDKVYRPQGEGCQNLPMDVSKSAILNQGKQVLLFGQGQTCQASSEWQTWAFGGTAWDGGKAKDARQGACKVPADGRWLRYFEDRTIAASLLAGRDDSENITADDMQSLLACGANFIGLDMLGYADSDRITGAIWSWNKGEPNVYGDGEDCAESHSNGRFNDLSCESIRTFACKNDNDEWYVTTGTGQWSEGKAICAAETDGKYTFATPQTYIQNQGLIQAKQAAGESRVWLAYTDQYSEGNWKIKTQVKDPFANFDWDWSDIW
ncbi:hypothetical protein [uncultured Shewanella sp.]|uniref:hypothetical protein n=1 Tax=uncultured Shewanella sp. TaxID=173975 RepID=UPI0026351C67|nr:hypothetical protein [uncultured Shewanella sp.]